MEEQKDSRRTFLTRVGTGVTVLGAAAAVAPGSAAAQTPADARFQPARHALDDWMDQASSKHRLVFDTTAADGIASRRVRVRPIGITSQLDSVIVIATVRYRGATVRGSPVRFVILVKPKTTP